MIADIRVGGVTVPLKVAEGWVRDYTDPARRSSDKPFAFPAYDTYEANADPYRLTDGELMAPGLLNVPVNLRTYYVLQDMRPMLEEALGAIAPSAKLTDTSHELVREWTEALYSPLDVPVLQGRGVRRTTLSKVLHRKRPHFIPLHDANVNQCYFGANGVIENDSKRSWGQSMAVFTAHIAADLQSQDEEFTRLRRTSVGSTALSHLRLLDIIAWNANGNSYSDDGAPIIPVQDDAEADRK